MREWKETCFNQINGSSANKYRHFRNLLHIRHIVLFEIVFQYQRNRVRVYAMNQFEYTMRHVQSVPFFHEWIPTAVINQNNKTYYVAFRLFNLRVKI